MRFLISRAPAATPIATLPPNNKAVPVPTRGNSHTTGAATAAAATPARTGAVAL